MNPLIIKDLYPWSWQEINIWLDQGHCCSSPLVDTSIALCISVKNRHLSTQIQLYHHFFVSTPSCTISTALLLHSQGLWVQKLNEYLSESFLYLFICGFGIHLQHLKETTTAEQVWCYSPCFRLLSASSNTLMSGWSHLVCSAWRRGELILLLNILPRGSLGAAPDLLTLMTSDRTWNRVGEV